MTKINMTIDTDDWEHGYEDDYGYEKGETFESFIRKGVIRHIGNHLIDNINPTEKEIMLESGKAIREKALKGLDLRVSKKVTKILQGKLEFNGTKETLEDAVLQCIENWRSKPDNSGFGNSRRISPLKEMIQKTVYDELSRETQKVLDDVKNRAIKQAQAKIAEIISVKLFDGKNLLENSLKG